MCVTFLDEHGLEGCVWAVYGVDMPGSKVDKILRAERHLAQAPILANEVILG
jgi:hypothetical protein